MNDISNQKQPRETSPTTRITSLSTLRALQKAAKQLNTAKDENREKSPIDVSRNKSSTPEKRIRDKTSPSSVKGGKLPKNPEELNNYELRKTFQIALSKLYTIETKTLALNELKTIIMNNQNPKNLRIFLSSLTEYKKVDNPNTQEIEVFLLGFIASQFKEDLIDPLDKVPALLKTCFRIIETIQTYFKVSAQNVAQACGYSLQQVYVHCLRRESVENKSLALYEPLAIIISGGTDRVSQTTASLCLCDLLMAAIETKDSEFLEDIRQKYVTLFLKVNYEISDLVKALGILMGSTDIRMSGSKLQKILERLIKYGQTTSSVYQIKIEVCSALSIIGAKLIGVAESFIGNLHEEVIALLKILAKDRLIKVQNAANEALKRWNNLKTEVQSLEAKKMTRDVVEEDIDELIKLRTGIDVNADGDVGQAIENMDVLPNDNNDEDDEPNPYILDKLRKGLKKKSGTGGGFVFLEKDKRPSSAVYATENKKKQSIKEMIQKSALDQGSNKKEKFDMQVRFPGQEFIQSSAETKKGKSVKSSVDLPSEMSFHPLIKDSAKALATPPLKNSSKASEYWHGSHESKKERQMELTNQLVDLQSQGYIKTVPQGQLVSSYEGPFTDHHSHESPSFPSSQVDATQHQRSQQRFASQMMKETSKSILEDSLNMRHYDNNTMMSQTVESMNFTSKAGRSTRDQQGFPKFEEGTTEQSRRMTENPSTRSQKEFLIRHNKSSSFKQKSAGPQSNSNFQETVPRSYQNLDEEGGPDLEETLAYDLGETWKADEKSFVQQRPKTGRDLSNIWDEVMKDLEKKDIEKAYERVVNSGDDIYLMRLMSKTGPCLEQLNRKTATDVTNRVVKLSGANFMEGIFMDVIKDGFELDLADSLTIEDQTNLLEELYAITANDTPHGRDANYLYSTLLTKVQK